MESSCKCTANGGVCNCTDCSCKGGSKSCGQDKKGDCCSTGCKCANCKCSGGQEASCCTEKTCCPTGDCCGDSKSCGQSGCKCSSSCVPGGDCCVSNKCCTTVAKVRKPAPGFEAMSYDNGFKKIKLSQFRGKYVVLFFYPLDFTFVCPTEIVQFSDKAKEFREAGCEVIGCSIDSHFTHMEYTKKDRKKGGIGKMDIPLIADIDKSIARKYGCLIEDGDDAGVSFRATYIIDKNGIVRHIQINDLPVGRNVDETLRLVKAFQYTDEFGEVCPASWKPGAATMHADTESQKTAEYWEKEHGKGV